MNSTAEKYSQLIKAKAKSFGFQDCGISKADFLEEDAHHLESWLNNNYHGEMKYMENHFDKRLDPRLLVEGSKSVISLSYNYFPEEKISALDNFKISKYAYAEDYHEVIKDILRELVLELHQEIGDFAFRVFVDSAPVMERSWAKKSGIGWVGKNSNLITKQSGSFYFLAEIICDLDLIPDHAARDHCGSCTKCIDACPTDAIVSDKIVDGSKCISYATIELKDQIPDYFKDKMEDWMFGCDICQDVCPWNRFSSPNLQTKFKPNELLKNFKKGEWKELTQELFVEIFRKSPVKRTKFAGLKRNIEFLDRSSEKLK
ncbi:tRNA epoxyqueuosine(34) reductase QueG [Chryseobacterium chendengshani]|uniref:tRNA epoxyqueuosine(34) reductase QueG n=1 Tax=unclassified Chryseobacterium TaxID=2593645 RepID=UPI001C640CFF|nr:MULTISPECIES: tRNA epoxyqueuosine(34) reductase QueG [unclassified Chryseobacterium]MBW7676768.1 tRNA epoxyqueuosine(34) reductase QueG [Chryseobacterium sp. LJ756]MBW8523311.1 tRNA epoxyqueuosine(34) reductase QueG [Chryseobacterium sp. LJ668]QYK15603.1 tRNA epoxyqueuosine(34) reductase QueG [Chryseobacterium sp. LJ668]